MPRYYLDDVCNTTSFNKPLIDLGVGRFRLRIDGRNYERHICTPKIELKEYIGIGRNTMFKVGKKYHIYAIEVKK